MFGGVPSIPEQIAEMQKHEKEWEDERSTFLTKISAIKKEQEEWPKIKEQLLNQLKTLKAAATASPSERQEILKSFSPLILHDDKDDENGQNQAQQGGGQAQDALAQAVPAGKKKMGRGGAKKGKRRGSAKSGGFPLVNAVTVEKTTSPLQEANEAEEQRESPYNYILKWTLTQHLDCIRAVAFHPTLPLIATASDDGTIRITNLDPPKKGKGKKTPVNLFSFRGHDAPILCLAAKGNNLISADLNGLVCMWDFSETKASLILDTHGKVDHHLVFSNIDHKDAVWSIATHENVPYFITASADKSIRLFDFHSHDSTQMSIPEGPSSVCFSLDGSTFAVGCVDGTVHIFKDRQSFCSHNFNSHIICICPSHSDDSFFISCENKNIYLFNYKKNEVSQEYVAHAEYTSAMALLPGEEFLVTTSPDKTIRAWRCKTFEVLTADAYHREKYGESGLCMAATLPTNTHKYFASGGADGVIKIFGIKGK